MRYLLLCLLTAACGVPVTPSSTPSSSTSTGGSGTTRTRPTGATGDTGDGPVLIYFALYDEARACWTSTYDYRPREYWEAWEEGDCDSRSSLEGVTVSDADGRCLSFWGPLEGDCTILDPWIQPCAASHVAGCCGQLDTAGVCFPAR